MSAKIDSKEICKMENGVASEIVQWLRTLSALAKHLGPIRSRYGGLHPSITPIPRNQMPRLAYVDRRRALTPTVRLIFFFFLQATHEIFFN